MGSQSTPRVQISERILQQKEHRHHASFCQPADPAGRAARPPGSPALLSRAGPGSGPAPQRRLPPGGPGRLRRGVRRAHPALPHAGPLHPQRRAGAPAHPGAGKRAPEGHPSAHHGRAAVVAVRQGRRPGTAVPEPRPAHREPGHPQRLVFRRRGVEPGPHRPPCVHLLAPVLLQGEGAGRRRIFADVPVRSHPAAGLPAGLPPCGRRKAAGGARAHREHAGQSLAPLLVDQHRRAPDRAHPRVQRFGPGAAPAADDRIRQKPRLRPVRDALPAHHARGGRQLPLAHPLLHRVLLPERAHRAGPLGGGRRGGRARLL